MLNKAKNAQIGNAGSNKREPAFVLVGKLQRPHGVNGEITMRVDTDFPERIRRGKTLYLGEDHVAHKVTGTRWKGDLMLVKFDGYDSPEAVSELINQMAFVSVDDIPALPDGEYYHHQLIGLEVYEADEYLGTLEAVLQTGANDVYIVEDLEGKELLIPAIPEVVLKVDLADKRLVVRLLEGLR